MGEGTRLWTVCKPCSPVFITCYFIFKSCSAGQIREFIHLFMLLCIFCCCFQGKVLFWNPPALPGPSGIALLICLCVPECWVLPANQTKTRIRERAIRVGSRCSVIPGGTGLGQRGRCHVCPLGNSFPWLKKNFREISRYEVSESYKDKSKSILKVIDRVSISLPDDGASVWLALETYLCSFGMSPPCGGRESDRHMGPTGFWFLVREFGMLFPSHSSGQK